MTDEPNPRRDFLLHEYGNLPQLIAHWDAHFWQKSQFFFAVESLLLGVVAVEFRKTFLEGATPGLQKFCELVGLSLFNFWLCYVWFRTNRSNREFLGALFGRARAIESALAAVSEGGIPENQPTFTCQFQSLLKPSQDRHASHWWENHLPTGFAASWVAVLITAAYFSPERKYLPWTLCSLPLALLALILIEKFHPKRSTRLEPTAENSFPADNPRAPLRSQVVPDLSVESGKPLDRAERSSSESSAPCPPKVT
jgi:hypothetical protein